MIHLTLISLWVWLTMMRFARLAQHSAMQERALEIFEDMTSARKAYPAV